LQVDTDVSENILVLQLWVKELPHPFFRAEGTADCNFRAEETAAPIFRAE